MFRKLFLPALVLASAGSAYAWFAAATPTGQAGSRPAQTAGLFARSTTGPLVYDLNKVTEILLTLGYTDIKFDDATPPGYKVTACKGRKKVKLSVSQWAEISASQPAGQCEKTLQFANAAPDLGFDDFAEDEAALAALAPPGTGKQRAGKQRAGRQGTRPARRHAAASRRATKWRKRKTRARRGIAVRAPGTRVRVTRNRIRVRAPFVSLDIPR